MTTVELTGFGRATRSSCDLLDVACDQVRDAVLAASDRGVLARGSGCSYGDAALNTGGRMLRLGSARANVVVTDGRLIAPAATTFADLLSACLPLGWTLPVLPGTRHLTLGGAIAADVHGKNHVRDGSLGRWLDEIVLVDGTGHTHRLHPGEPAFDATVGGMGLTGVVVAASLRLVPVETSWLQVTHQRCHDLDDLLATLDAAACRNRWAVAWVDGLATGRGTGRGIVSGADEAEPDDVRGSPLAYRPTSRLTAPSLPVSAVNSLSAKLFNAAWWRRGGHLGGGVTSLTSFFHPLDGVTGWNRLYGPAGFLQHQFVVPDEGVDVLARALARLRAADAVPFLGVLKRFGPAGDGHLSFPREGWSLAVDLPPTAGLPAALDDVDRLVADAGGAVYLAKDARLSPGLLPVMYPALEKWRSVQGELDPNGVFRSDLDRRLGLVRRA